MKIQKIYKKLVDQFKGDDDISITYKNGRIIISMKRDNKVWNKEQEQWLHENVTVKIDKLIDLFESHSKSIKDHINESFEKHVNQYHK